MARRGAGYPARQCHRRVDRPASPKDRRSVPGQAAPHHPGRRIRPSPGSLMRIASPTVRARLTLWHAAALTLVVCLFAAGVFVFVRSSLYRSLDQQIREDLATIEKVYREETGDLGELALRTSTQFEVTEGTTVIYRTVGWPPASTTPFRRGTAGDSAHRIVAARDERPGRQTLGSLGAPARGTERAVCPVACAALPGPSGTGRRRARAGDCARRVALPAEAWPPRRSPSPLARATPPAQGSAVAIITASVHSVWRTGR